MFEETFIPKGQKYMIMITCIHRPASEISKTRTAEFELKV